MIRRNKVHWFDLNAEIKIVPFISERYIRDADITMANHWPTVSDVAVIGKKKFNFVNTNPWMHKPELEIESFKEEVSRIVVSSGFVIFD